MVESQRLLPIDCSKKWRLSETVDTGCLRMSSLDKPLRGLVHLQGPAASPFWFERGSSASDPRVALDRGETDLKKASGRELGQASFS